MKRHWRLVATITLLVLIGGISWFQRQAESSHADLSNGPATVAIERASAWPVSDAQVETLVRQAVDAAGGLSSTIHLSETVVLKPNLMWDAAPDEGYTTDPRVVRTLVRMAREVGAGQVIIADGAAQYRDGHDARGSTVRAFRVCGYDADGNMLDDETGAPLVDLNDAGGLDQHDPALVTQVNLPSGLIWNSYWLPRTVITADVVIGVPVLKNHFVAGVTLGLKNQIGIAPSDIYHNVGSNMYKGQLSHGPNDLGRHIVDLNLARRLDFVVVDALRGMTDGPSGGTLADPPMELVLAGSDAVAVDTVGTLVMGYDPSSVPYLGLASNAGLGTTDVAQIAVRGARVSQVRRDFPAPSGDPPAQRAESTPPTVHINAPVNGSLVTTTITVRATAEDDRSIAKVEFYAGDDLLTAVTSAPYEAALDLSRYQGQDVSLRAIAYDHALNDAQDSVSVTVMQSNEPGTTLFKVTSVSIPTYPYTPYLEIRSNGPYTYPWLNWNNYDPSPIVPFTYTLLTMENDYLRVTVLPELGGRVYQMIWKPTSHDELYQNPVIKPTHWGPIEQGWWLAAGGIEWALPVDEHGYEWGEPWAWSVVTSTAGVTVTVRDTDAANRMHTAIDLALPADRAYLVIRPHLENPTSSDLNTKFWLNAMLAPGAANTVGPDLHWIFNSSEMAVHSTGDDRHFDCAGWTHTSPDCLFPWPVHDGVDFSRLGNWREYLGFFEYPKAAADFAGVYDTAANEGVARVFPSDVARGVKGFGMGRPNSGYQIDPNTWTDDGSTYVELHGGVAPAFWDWATLPASQTLTWQEYWYPVSSIGIFSTATSEAAITLRQDSDNFIVNLHSTAARPASESKLWVWDRTTCAQVGQWNFAIDPASPFSTSFPTNGRVKDNLAVIYTDSTGKTLAAIRPINCRAPDARVLPLPSFVETTTFTVAWVRPEDVTGVGTFQVQSRDGYEAEWTDWLTSTQNISATFTGQHGHTYLFRARTIAPQQNSWSNEDWGQAFTTVLTEAAPVLVTSYKKGVWSTLPVVSDTETIPTDVISYSVLISNTGNLTAMAMVTDATPAGTVVLTDTLTADHGPQPTYSDGNILWNDNVSAGESVRLSYALVPMTTIQRGDRFTNTAILAGSVLGPVTRQVVMTYWWQVWLPIVARQ